MFSQVTLPPKLRRSFTSAFTLALVFGLLGGCTHQNSSTGADTASTEKGSPRDQKPGANTASAVKAESAKQEAVPSSGPVYELSELDREAAPQEAPFVPPGMPKVDLDEQSDEEATAAAPPSTAQGKTRATPRYAPTKASRSTTWRRRRSVRRLRAPRFSKPSTT